MFDLFSVKLYTGSVRYRVDVAGAYLQKFIDDQRKEEGIDLDPDFQRGHVWEPENQIRYIEHLLRGGETARTLIWNCPSYETYGRPEDSDAPQEMVIVDGKQRLTALLAFLDSKVPVFGGHVFKDFDERSQREVLSPTGRLRMQMSIHALQYRHELLQIYVELNEGAIAHSPEEIARVKALQAEAMKQRGIS